MKSDADAFAVYLFIFNFRFIEIARCRKKDIISKEKQDIVKLLGDRNTTLISEKS